MGVTNNTRLSNSLSHIQIQVPAGKALFFASDFHLGVPNFESSRRREDKVIKWLDTVAPQAAAIFLVGDLFDFWWEYKTVVPKGFVRFLGRLAYLTDHGMPVHVFTGNHDLWMKDYLTQETGVTIWHKPVQVEIMNDDKILLVGHGDGLGPGDQKYKLTKKYMFTVPFLQKVFTAIHPDWGIGLANAWSRSSRKNHKENEKRFLGENEWLWQYCQEVEAQQHHDGYIFGHRHLPLDLPVGDNSKYINLGDWIQYFTYATYKAGQLELLKFDR